MTVNKNSINLKVSQNSRSADITFFVFFLKSESNHSKSKFEKYITLAFITSGLFLKVLKEIKQKYDFEKKSHQRDLSEREKKNVKKCT